MRSARDSKSSGEVMGSLKGGHETLVLAAAERARELGADIRLGAGVEGLLQDQAGAVTGVQVDGAPMNFDQTIVTLQPPALRRLLPESALAAACGLPGALPRRRLPDPQAAPLAAALLLGQHLRPDADHDRRRDLARGRHRAHRRPAAGLPAEVLRRRRTRVHRGRRVDLPPLHRDAREASYRTSATRTSSTGRSSEHRWSSLSTRSATSPAWPPSGPAFAAWRLASASQIYPRLLNGESVLGMAEQVAQEALARVHASQAPPSSTVQAAAA